MAVRRTRSRSVGAALAVVMTALALVAACGSSGDGTTAESASTTSTELAPGDSGAFALASVPDGFEIDRAFADDGSDRKSISYLLHGDDDQPGWTIAASSWPDDQPPFADLFGMVEDRGGAEGLEEADVRGHRAFVGPNTSDGRPDGTMVIWEERPGFVVEIRVSDGAGVDPVALATDTYEISDEAFEALKVGTTGGGVPGARVEAVTGEVDGDPYVLTAVLPEGYPVQPIDRRAGCAELTFRGESATTCDEQLVFAALDAADQVVLGGVNFAYGVFRDGSGGVLIAPVETPQGPWEPADAAVVAGAPNLTWFVHSFPRVCDRSALSKGGNTLGIGVPPGYPHSKCD